MARNQMKTMMEGAVVLTVASFIAKLLSAIYRVPFQNIVGDEGFYVYQQVYPIYGIAMTFALTGFPQFLSKLVAEQTSPKEKQRILNDSYSLLCWCALALWGFTFFFSRGLASSMGDPALVMVIRVASFTFLLMPVLSLYRGLFQGELLMVPTAVSQVIEQLLRVGIILLSATGFTYFSLTIYQTGAFAMAGAFVGGVAAWLVLLYYDRKIYGIHLRVRLLAPGLPKEKWLIRRFFVEGGLVSIYSGMLILFQLVDSFLIVNSLTRSGLIEQSAKVAKGVYDRGQPLVQLGLVVATALSATFLPALTKLIVQKNKKQFVNSAKIYLRFTTAIAGAASCGLVVLIPYLNFALFKDSSGNLTLMAFVFAVGLMAEIQAYQSIAQSQGSFLPALKAAGVGLGIKLLATGILTFYLGTFGASLSTLLGLIGVLLYLIHAESKSINDFRKDRHFAWKLLSCILLMATILALFFIGFTLVLGPVKSRTMALGLSLFGVLLGASIFVKAAVTLRLFTIREWLLLPFGKKILRIGGKSNENR
ncbi:polysaccharide biosynthesis protein [Tetragenococcus koreensis]|uniref:Polysaccharide transporter n=1 Tax=Tetragenococcus koreensis TaxID=290335 RepID=A0AAN4ZR76_9ENTE|nr:polysaccharide biosynthesis protein [Tetragenococcus koreensis]MCF1584659.1 polysaccharide biosynthesis protein [Tetragenococcus koreensis]MCF1614311.1 polysaccharide biosynthesis protein [Tetragenococcus koreensis]MCF1616462.1 polysaccharide biosynthesis protein [Tetragenococcus koreensis]MCF1619633.1 polysaccharide biosynthesis protein [Tetragenococcus koreensis]MCF1621394.1 polysaccharide biosynthesis protein [Tetragenococcus koreensis]